MQTRDESATDIDSDYGSAQSTTVGMSATPAHRHGIGLHVLPATSTVRPRQLAAGVSYMIEANGETHPPSCHGLENGDIASLTT